MEKLSINDLVTKSGVNFGTSGIRSLETDLTDYVCYCFTIGFIQFLEATNPELEKRIAIAGDFRQSTDRMMNAISRALIDKGYRIVNCGNIPTPALTYYGIQNKIASIMVTGSHIPEDRNGIKYNKVEGEILKDDESLIKQQVIEIDNELFDDKGYFKSYEYFVPVVDSDGLHIYMERYTNFFKQDSLKGLKIGLYGHSAVGRNILFELLNYFGATVTRLKYSSKFIPVDTEAISTEMVNFAKEWVRDLKLDCIVTLDGDSDRPGITDEDGNWLRGDVLGILVSKYLEADYVAVTASCNTALEKSGYFKKVTRTKIGSPYVIAAMYEGKKEGFQVITGYEANGGFLTLNDKDVDGWILKALPTRDAIVAILSLLSMKVSTGKKISDILNELPQRYTYSDRIKEFPTEKSNQMIDKLISSASTNNLAFTEIAPDYNLKITEVNILDGVRMTFENNEIIHLRPSGNAPELRCYTEADSETRAIEICELVMSYLEKLSK